MAEKTNVSIAATLTDAADDRVMAKATIEYFGLDKEQTLVMEDEWIVGPLNKLQAYGNSWASPASTQVG